jgi:predicted oxidoreductase (fatty acid repression mutant protein)
MVIVSEIQHPRSLDFTNQRKVVLIRDQEGLSWDKIAKRVVNLKGEHPSWKHCSEVYERFQESKGRVLYKYGNCGFPSLVYQRPAPQTTFPHRQDI